LLPDFQLSGYAGPFGSKDKATQFLTAWVGSQKHVKLSDVDKFSLLDFECGCHHFQGYERVGRELSEKHHVKWAESWCFLDRFVDLRSDDGLELLNSYLGCVKQKETQSSMDGLRKRLTFDDEDGKPSLR
uniref:Alpha-type protein kinase domain-containing protein n=1 Tax=Heligmosomoides polygyrus TaxID=6339 RepID=A0A183FY07_HELPZ